MNEELQKHTLNLRSDDYRRIQSYYPDIGAAVIIRRLVSDFVDKVEAAGGAPSVGEVEINI